MDEIKIILFLSLIIFSSPLLSNIFKIPTIIIEIILGSVLITFKLINAHEIFTLVAELGFLYLMFLAGLEIDLKEILKLPKKLILKAFFYSILLYIFSAITVFVFNLDKIFIVIVPLISIGLLAALKKEYNKAKWLDFAIVVGLVGEIISIIVLTLVGAGLEFGIGYEFVKALGLLGIVLVVIGVIYYLFHIFLWWYPEIKTKLMPKFDTFEQDIRVSMSIFFFALAMMLYLHLELALGAFIAGAFISTFFHHKKDLPKKLEHFGFGWLVPIFFVWVGSTFDFDSFIFINLFKVSIQIVLATILFRILAIFVLFYNDIKFKDKVLVAISHSMPLTLVIAVATLALINNTITQFYYYVFILSALLEVIISMSLIKIIVKKDKNGNLLEKRG